MKTKHFALLLFCYLLSATAIAQDKDEQLASQFFANSEFDKAAVLYDKLHTRKPNDVYIYDNLIKCYISLKQYDEAEKTIRKAQKRNRENPSYSVDLGYLFKLKGKEKESKDVFDRLLKDLKPDEYYTEMLSKAFQKREEWTYAADTYLKFRKLAKNEFAFSLDLAQLYARLSKEEEMINEFLSLLAVGEEQLEDIEGFLGAYLDGKGGELIKKLLIKRIQENPERIVFPELLIWVYNQQQQYESAFIQCKAIDKRFKLKGRRVFEFAEWVKTMELYDLATRAYQVVLESGEGSPFSLSARYGLLEVRSKKLLSGNYTPADLVALETEYKKGINDLGINHLSANFIKDLAHLQAFYLNKQDSAIELLKELTSMQGIKSHLRAEAKLELGDIYMFTNDLWEATLMYEQVDYDFKEDPLGQEAKFRNAKLTYFRGDFEWAQAQLEILKTATTQLISNNAIELSLLILDNTGIDSTEDAMQLYAQADLFIYQNKTDSALILLAKLEKQFPDHALSDEILYQKGLIALNKKDYNKALEYFTQVWKTHGQDVLADNALIISARIQEKNLNNKDKALELYDQFISTYPSSFFSAEARLHYRLLRGDRLSQ